MRRIGLTQRVVIDEHTRERRDALDQGWTSLLQQAGYWPVPLANDVSSVSAYLDALALDGFILTGGNDLASLADACAPAPERDRFEERLIDFCTTRRVPLLGVCRGLQVLAARCGSLPVAVDGHAGSRHALRWTPGVTALPAADVQVNSYHRRAVRGEDLDESWMILARADRDVVEAMRHCHLPQWAVMWHPERDETPAAGAALLRSIFETEPACAPSS